MSHAARFCRGCDYDLSATPPGPCPECGRQFDPADPRSTVPRPRRSWHARARRWGPLLAFILLLAALWPGGALLMTVTWVDPASTTTIAGRALVIGRPWWLGGWWPAIGWSFEDGPAPSPRNNGEVEQFAIAIHQCDAPALWRWRTSGSGRIAVMPVPPVRSIAPDDWRNLLLEYTRAVAAGSAEMSASTSSTAIVAPTPPWAIQTDHP